MESIAPNEPANEEPVFPNFIVVTVSVEPLSLLVRNEMTLAGDLEPELLTSVALLAICGPDIFFARGQLGGR
jgi:hypothetical protein